MGLIKNEHGVYLVRKKVPQRLQKAVAEIRGGPRAKQTFLQRSLRTKSLSEAKISAKPVLIEFDSILARAAGVFDKRPLRSSLPAVEIKRLADYHYATRLADDDAGRRNSEIIKAKYHGKVNSFEARREAIFSTLTEAKEAYAKGDLNYVVAEVEEVLSLFAINLETDSGAYRALSLAILEREIKAFGALARRLEGELVETPKQPAVPYEGEASGETITAAFDGWQKERTPSPNTLTEFGRAIALFKELHGDMRVADIRRNHAREFREALQLIPRHRPAALRNLSLRKLAEWGEKHPDAQKISAPTINKLIGGVQAVCVWGHDKGGMVGDDVAWADPFARTRLEEDDPEREPFHPEELAVIFRTPVFTVRERPVGGKGEAAFWLPILALFTGARRSEIAGLTADAIVPIEGEGLAIVIARNKRRGTRLKTKGSQRTVPIHPTVVSLGFADYLHEVRAKAGASAWLFPEVAPDKAGAVKAWTKWFSRYIRAAGVTDVNKVFHSFRHRFKDALRAGGVNEDVADALAGQSTRGMVNRSYGAKDIVKRFGGETLIAAIAKAKFEVDLSSVAAWQPHQAVTQKRK